MKLVMRMMNNEISENSNIGKGEGVNKLWEGNLRFRERMRKKFIKK